MLLDGAKLGLTLNLQDGYFKIVRGKNECGIEEDVTAGLPSLKNLIKNLVSKDVPGDSSV